MQTVFGIKQGQRQIFLEDGTRVPVTVVSVPETTVTQLKSNEKEGYNALQIGLGQAKKSKKSTLGHLKKSNLTNAPKYLREVRFLSIDEMGAFTLGSKVVLEEILKPGDLVSAQGVSKGKGFAGGVKRHGFGGGPKTHGQSDRHRAPGAIGQGTTPGRVYKGKRMAGRMGSDQVTVKNLFIVDVQGSDLYVSGLIPGGKNSLVRIEKTGEKKNFVPVFNPNKKEDEPVEVVEPIEEIPAEGVEALQTEEVKTEEVVDEAVQTEEQKAEASESAVEEPRAESEISQENKEEEKVDAKNN